MKVYKYRGVANLERDIKSLVEDNFFAPTAEALNDPTEVVLNDRLVSALLSGLSPEVSASLAQLTGMRHSVGVYSLSRVPTDELMWAHYSESHAGFCIEYDFERLVLEARNQWTQLDVVYSKDPPILTVQDLLVASDASLATAKLTGYKSLRWRYESELRLITARAGVNHYARAAVTGIYFGVRCSKKIETQIRTALRNRALTYSRMVYPAHSYQLAIETLTRDDIDGVIADYVAPVEAGAIVTNSDLGEFSDRYTSVRKAVEIVRRDPSCKKIVLAEVSRTGARRGQIFVQFETTVKGDLNNVLNWYFDHEELSKIHDQGMLDV